MTTSQEIGNIEMTGGSFGPHLHLEPYPYGIASGQIYQSIDPAGWLHERWVAGF